MSKKSTYENFVDDVIENPDNKELLEGEYKKIWWSALWRACSERKFLDVIAIVKELKKYYK